MSQLYPVYIIIGICVVLAAILIINIIKNPKKSENKQESNDNIAEPSIVETKVERPTQVKYEEYFDLDNFFEEDITDTVSKDDENLEFQFDDLKSEWQKVDIKANAESDSIIDSKPEDDSDIQSDNVRSKVIDNFNPAMNINPEKDRYINDVVSKLKNTYNEFQLEEIRNLLFYRPDLDANKIKLMIKKDRSPEEIREYASKWC